MWTPNVFQIPDPAIQKAEERGFRIAESYFEKATTDYLKMIKKGLIRMKATTSTSHKCNCEFCTF
jgi:hypothetical protein